MVCILHYVFLPRDFWNKANMKSLISYKPHSPLVFKYERNTFFCPYQRCIVPRVMRTKVGMNIKLGDLDQGRFELRVGLRECKFHTTGGWNLGLF